MTAQSWLGGVRPPINWRLEPGTWWIALPPTVAFALPNDYLEFKRRFEK
jgi:hypothetical protein